MQATASVDQQLLVSLSLADGGGHTSSRENDPQPWNLLEIEFNASMGYKKKCSFMSGVPTTLKPAVLKVQHSGESIESTVVLK